MPPFGDFPGMSVWEKTLEQTRNSLEGFHIFSGLGTPWGPPGAAGECFWGEGCVCFSPGPGLVDTMT